MEKLYPGSVASTSVVPPGAVSSVSAMIDEVHSFLSELDRVTSELVGEPNPEPADDASAVGFPYSGQLGVLVRQSASVSERIAYAKRRLVLLSQAAG